MLIVFLDGDKLAWLLRLSPAACEAMRLILSGLKRAASARGDWDGES
jgi:hypothetical protein